MRVVHISPLEPIDLVSARQAFGHAKAHILPFNDPRNKEGCLSAVVLTDDQHKFLESVVGSINMQSHEQVGYKNVLTIVS
jgi:hypothetical protein